MTEELLVFRLDDRCCGLRIAHVREVLRAVAISPLPGEHPELEGLVNVRGEAVPVLDLRTRFGLPRRPIALTDCLIVLSQPGRLAAVRADAGVDLHRVESADIGPVDPSIRQFSGVCEAARIDEQVVFVLDVDHLLEGIESAHTGYTSISRLAEQDGT
ncbi:chemotaxis protein CheW [Maioricimonas rarisocia]|nr:chemotaxis protein CheW [Maioricimonas rarisocia]